MNYPSPSPPTPPGGWPKISVVVPSFNQGRFLRATLDSILSQGYPNLECIVVDGGSTDDSVEVIRSVADKIAWWCSEKDKGHADALNKGFARTTGDVMCWLNSDDLFTPWCLWTIGDVFARLPDVEWLSGAYGIWDAHGRLVAIYPSGATAFSYLRNKEFNIQQESTFWRRSLWTKAGGKLDESYRLMIDAELWLRFFRHAKLFALKTVVSGYRWHGENRAIKHAQQAAHERWKAIETHVAPMSRRARRVASFGPQQFEKPTKFSEHIKRKVQKKLRKRFLPREKAPSITWNTATSSWQIQLQLVP